MMHTTNRPLGLAITVAAVALLTVAGRADAEPMFLSKQYTRCTACHYSQTGGGLLTPYGRLLADVMGAAYPEWVQPLPPPVLDAGARIRVGVVSGCVWRHSVYKTHGAWLRELMQ